ncbi:glycosyltransferase family 4 protein [Paenibacillus cremeus]|uniref:Glycosyltransferase family 4 protein n=2 Tax=Paenibacillus cremeus TaxID=2163881 RepID=A0A559KIR8_9BACL|nr:glycosyltransferase family 4 protein [Paenibacillus cremeus]
MVQKGVLRVAQIISNAPAAYPLPPVNQGGTEKVVYELTEELVRRGIEVYLYAARGSSSHAKTIWYPTHLKEAGIRRFVARTLPKGVNLVHDHTFSSAIARRRFKVPTLCTQHIVRNNGAKNSVYVSKRALQIVGKNKGDFVYNGININEYEFSAKKGDYLLFMGRIVKEKGILKAIEVAEKTGLKLLIAGPIKDHGLFEREIKPRLQSNIEYVGAVGGAHKQHLLKHARCLLFPSLWEEPFGLVMIEAMACGTPVLALRNGSVPEVLGGFPNLICDSMEEMARKVLSEPLPSPEKLRSYVESHFTNLIMTDRYLEIYHRVRSQSGRSKRAGRRKGRNGGRAKIPRRLRRNAPARA